MRNLHSIRRWGIVCAMVILALTNQAQTLQSPDGKYQFNFTQKDGRLTYSLNYASKQAGS